MATVGILHPPPCHSGAERSEEPGTYMLRAIVGSGFDASHRPGMTASFTAIAPFA
jgi:hypothetical protein